MTSTTSRWAAFSQPSFRRLLLGSSLSSFGDSALYLSLGIWAKDLTGSNAAAGGVFLAHGLASLLAPVAGHLVDRRRRKPVLLIANGVTAVAVLALLLIHSREQLWLMYVVAIFYGASFTVIGPAKLGLVKDLLPDRDLAGANAAFTTIGQGLRLISPLVGAALYARFGGGSLALLDAATFVVATAMTATVRVTESPILPRTRCRCASGFSSASVTCAPRRPWAGSSPPRSPRCSCWASTNP
jgi:MFS family permease